MPTLQTDLAEMTVREMAEELEEQRSAIDKMQHDTRQQIERVMRQSYDSNGRYRGVFDNEDEATAFGLCVMARSVDQRVAEKARTRLEREFKNLTRDMGSTVDNAGGGLIPSEFSARVKRLAEMHGAYFRNAFRMPMNREEMTFIKQTEEIEVFLVSQGSSGQATAVKGVNVNLNAKEWGTLTFYPRSLEADAIVAMSELIARSVGFAFGYKGDKIAFNGDSAKESFGILGIIPKLLQINGVDDGGGLILGSGNAGSGWSGLVIGDFCKMQGRLPEFEGMHPPKWYCSRTFYYTVMVPIMLAGGGVTATEIAGQRQKTFLGDEVEFVQVMSKVSGHSQVACLYGDMQQATTYGDRQEMKIEESRDYKFAERQVTVLGTMRTAVSVEDLGTADAAGPLVGLITKPGT